MRIALSLLSACVLLVSLPALAQSPATLLALPPMKSMATAADVQNLIAKARAEMKEGDTYKGETIVQLEPHNVSLNTALPRCRPRSTRCRPSCITCGRAPVP